MRKRILSVVLIVALAAVAYGCSRRSTVQIESNTCWTAQFDNQQSTQDCGNVTYKVIGPLNCVEVRKSSVNGTVRVRIDNGPWAETSDSLGVVQVCR